MEFNNVTFMKWYNQLINATQGFCIPQDILNLNKRNITFGINHHYTFFWMRHANLKDFHTRMLPFYLEKESFEKKVMSWNNVKHNPRKLGMHYLFPAELLKKKG
jgi:hypothetical protein